MNKHVVIIMMSLILWSCKSKQVVLNERTEYIETVRDSTVIIPADSSWLKALLECDSMGNVHVRELQAYAQGKHIVAPKIGVKDNVLIAECKVDSFGVFFSWVQKHGLTRKEIPVEVPVEVPVMGWIWWVGLLVIIAGAACVVGYILWRTPLIRWIKMVLK